MSDPVATICRKTTYLEQEYLVAIVIALIRCAVTHSYAQCNVLLLLIIGIEKHVDFGLVYSIIMASGCHWHYCTIYLAMHDLAMHEIKPGA